MKVEVKELYHFRREKIERSFADSKNNHGYRYAMYRGLEKNQNYTWLICAAQNMKNGAIKNDNVGKEPLTLSSLTNYFIKLVEKFIKFNSKNFCIRKPLEKSRGLSTT